MTDSVDDVKQEVNIAILATDVKYIRMKIDGHCDDMKAMNARVSSLENWRSGIVACLVMITVLVGWAIAAGYVG